jgi:hypothetical protein
LLRSEAKVKPEIPSEISLVAQLIQANYNAYSSTTQELMSSYLREIDELTATVSLIRSNIDDAVNRPYIPSHHVLINALHPSDDDVKALAAKFQSQRE